MPNVLHKNLTGADAVHPAAFVQSADPGSVGANLIWIDTTTGPPYILKLRNTANTAWLLFAAGIAGATGATGTAGPTGSSGAPGSITVSGAVPYICMQDRKTLGTAGGTFTSGSFQTRTLTTIVANSLSLASLDTATSRITLPAGTWRIHVRAPAALTNRHQARLQNITSGGTILSGSSAYANSAGNVQTDSIIQGSFPLREQSVLEVQHRAETTSATNGLGVPGSFGTELYTSAEFWLEGGPPPFFGSPFDIPSSTTFGKRTAIALASQTQLQHSPTTTPQ